jgi:hypothetical protein
MQKDMFHSGCSLVIATKAVEVGLSVINVPDVARTRCTVGS